MPPLTDDQLGKIVYEAIGGMVPGDESDYDDFADWYGIPNDREHADELEAVRDLTIPWDVVLRNNLCFDNYEMELDAKLLVRIGKAVRNALESEATS